MISRGSQWRRWEPHIHAPGTILNNQFKGDDPWGEYLTALEELTPRVEAIAVTDYYVTDTYEQVLKYKVDGRLPDVQLIFPNIELRLDVAAKSGFVNIHLLVSPEDPEHVTELQRILTRLQFLAYSDRFDCTRSELIRLGKRANPSIIDDHVALQHGATQFKVNFTQLREVYHQSEWAKNNIIIAVAGGVSDGTSGVRQAADTTMRQEIETFAHIIFSSSAAQRDFWIGRRSVDAEELRERYNGCKPCLHGSDSHHLKTVGQPVENRFSWIKGGVEFDALRQACIDPEGRAFVGAEPPPSAMPSQVISDASIADATWAQTPQIPLNPGLVAIIGSRGSGKTALADMIAAGCDSISPIVWNASENTSPSFLSRAKPLIGDATITLTWGVGGEATRALDGRDANGHLLYPRARYLSQQFVEELCSSNGVSDGLIKEMERVILEAHPLDEREGAINFEEFREFRTSRFRQARNRESEAISDLSDRIAIELEKENLVSTLRTQVAQKKILIDNYKTDLAKLVVKGTEIQVKRHEELGKFAEALREKIQAFTNQRRTFITMQDEVLSTRATKAPELLRQARDRHSQSGLDDSQWEDFLLIYKGNVDASLAGYVAWADKNIAELNGMPMLPRDPSTPFIADDVDLGTLNLTTIVTEMTRLESLFSADKVVRDQYAALTKRIGKEAAVLKGLEAKYIDAEGATHRKKGLQTERDDVYGRIFEAVINEQSALAELYGPLMERLAASSGTLGKLGFSVRRVVDVKKWGTFAEENLLDRRKSGPFNGRGSLTVLAEEKLKPAWENGDAAVIQGAMTSFISAYIQDLLAHAPYAPEQQTEYKTWLKQFAHWLFGTDHISVRYEILYDRTDIRKLSPGTRGVVLLLLYLALDETDDRPLIIDQPEENLDPKSVNDELVPLFIAAKAKRQVIMVTHNANLVINTNADQIIIAEVGAHQEGGLPPITYRAGGLENSHIRKAVCDILEGGESAFQERARRLRVRLER
ncbi:AAA domain-containing protein, putative AbiEii toxin, Type IV TA system [Neptunomonas qingdaonensis]|uniref:AAA domain-containing protein, putative AbiEii toxin, Type IV TA system n=2 Tax=Neptunomonas qingdaonensis TaxID=1045558 RepID=A0A1I2MWG1_9GAMM|nr:AAA domain-containing protein, putative AbiEii toxin, Type IV TA system [Neptunomonas qingdaonensis]